MTERRKNMRVAKCLKIIYIHDDDYLISHSSNLSVDGMYLYTPDPPGNGDIIEIRFALSEDDQVAVPAKVVWVHTGFDGADSGVGVRFLQLPPDTQALIRNAVRRIAVLGSEELPV